MMKSLHNGHDMVSMRISFKYGAINSSHNKIHSSVKHINE